MIKRGNRIKLTARAAAAFNKNKHKFVWTDRRGVVDAVGRSEVAGLPADPQH